MDKLHYLTEEEFDHLASAIADTRDRAIFECLFSSGMRISELLGVSRALVDGTRSNTLELSIIGKGKKRRTVYLSGRALKVCRAYLATRKDSDTRLFPVLARTVQYMMKRYDPRLHPHVLRHSFATHLLDKGVNLYHVKEMCGHASIVTTQKYLHYANATLKDIHKKIYK